MAAAARVRSRLGGSCASHSMQLLALVMAAALLISVRLRAWGFAFRLRIKDRESQVDPAAHDPDEGGAAVNSQRVADVSRNVRAESSSSPCRNCSWANLF